MGKKGYVKQHYVPQLILENFTHSNEPENLYYLDLIHFKVDRKSTGSIFYEDNLYDSSIYEDVKAIEKKLGKFIESSMADVNKALLSANKQLEITRKDVETIKKYLLIQIYRSTRNRMGYELPTKNPVVFSSYNKLDNETNIDFWKKEIDFIINHSWDEILASDLVGVKHHASLLYEGFLCFYKTDDEFVLNDLGYVTERVPLTVSAEIQKMTDSNLDNYSKSSGIPSSKIIAHI